MQSLEEVRDRCLVVCHVPMEVSTDIIHSHVKRHLRDGRICDTDEGIESSTFKRLVLLCSSTKDVIYVCEEVKKERIQTDNSYFMVKYQRALVCDLPDRWGHLKQETQFPHIRQEPPSKPGQRDLTRRNLQQIPQNALPYGPYVMMPGFNQNPQVDTDHTNVAMHKYKMPQLPMHRQGQTPIFAKQPSCQPFQGGQHMPLGMPIYMPMYYDPQTGQMHPVPQSGFPILPQQESECGGELRKDLWTQPPELYYDCKEIKRRGYTSEDKSRPYRKYADDESQSPAVSDEKENREEKMKVHGQNQRKIIVRNLPPDLDDEYLEMFFENRRKFGDGISVFLVDLDKTNATAIVEFDQPQVVDIVLNKCPIKMMGQEVIVTAFKPEPPVSLCTIEVTGPCNVVCEPRLEALELYFENERRSGGGDVVDCRFDPEHNMVLVTFEEEEVAQRVIKRGNHRMNSEKLTVKQYIPTTSDKPDFAAEEEQAASRITDVKCMDKSLNSETVERSWKSDLEMGSTDENEEDIIHMSSVRKWKNGTLLAVSGREEGAISHQELPKRLKETSSIYSESKTNIAMCKKELEADLEKLYTKRKIENYKEIIKSLTREEMKELDIFALANIMFDTQAGVITIEGQTKQVSDVTHELQMKLLKIERNRNDTKSAEELFKLVQWQYEEVTEIGFRLIPYDKKLNHKIEQAYKANKAKIEFEDDNGDCFVIDFKQLIEYRKYDDQDRLRVLRKDILKAPVSALPEEWADMKDNENVKVVSIPSENIIERKLQSSEQVWIELIEFFELENVSTRDVVATLNNHEFEILLIGFNDPVKNIFRRLEEKQAEIEKRLNRRTQTVRCNDLKLRLLDTIGVFQDLQHQLEDLHVYIRDGEVTIEGQPEDISVVQVKMYDMDNEISLTKWSHGFSSECVDFVERKLLDKVNSILKNKGITAVWTIDRHDINVCAFERPEEDNDYQVVAEDHYSYQESRRVGKAAEEILRSAVVETQENVQDSIIEVLTSPEWISFLKHITETYENDAEVAFKDSLGKIIIYGMKREADIVQKRVKDFLEENAIRCATVKSGTINVRFIQMHRQNFVERLEKELEDRKVKIELQDNCINIRGNKKGIAEAKKKFKSFFDGIICEKHTIQKVAMKDVFRNEKEQGTIACVEKETSCLIKLPGENATFVEQASIADESDDSDDGYLRPIGASGSSHGVEVGNINLSVFIDDILSQKTEAVVSRVGRDFEFISAEAHELKNKCPKIEAECHKKENTQKLQSEGVVMTKSFGLLAKYVIHVRYAETLDDWQKRFRKCLELANKMSLKTVAFPVLDTGKCSFGSARFKTFHPEAIAGCMFDAVNDFVQAVKNPSVNDIRLIVYKGQPTLFTPIMDKLHKNVQEAASAATSGSDGSWTNQISKTVTKLRKRAIAAVIGKEEGVMSDQELAKLLKETSSMEVHIYSDSKTNIERCKKELEAKLEKLYTKRKIENYKEIIKTLTQEEMKELDIIAQADINLDTQAGVITIEGPTKQVSDVTHELQMKLLKIERNRNDTKSAEELFKLVQWQYEEVTEIEFKLIPYDKKLNQKIEQAYKANKAQIEFDDDDGDCFVIDFKKLIEYRKSDDQDKLRVLRKDILKAAVSALPEEWADMKDNENIKVVSIPSTDKTYQDISNRFLTEVKTGSYAHRLNFNPNNMQVKKIERIQNRALYHQYQEKRKQMTEQKPNLPANMPVERELWHGTKYDAVTSIQMHGLNRSYSGNANGEPWYGEGVYFAGNASYSARGWLSGAGAGSKGYMFLVKTLTGELYKGRKGLRYLPAVDAKDPTILYDCAVDNLQNPMEFVIFNDTQAYPAYIITFTT